MFSRSNLIMMLALVSCCLFLSSCLEIGEKILINKDGSAQYIRSIGISNSLFELGNALSNDDDDNGKPKNKRAKKSKKKDLGGMVQSDNPFASMDEAMHEMTNAYKDALASNPSVTAITPFTAVNDSMHLYFFAIEVKDYHAISEVSTKINAIKLNDQKLNRSRDNHTVQFIDKGDSIGVTFSGYFETDRTEQKKQKFREIMKHVMDSLDNQDPDSSGSSLFSGEQLDSLSGLVDSMSSLVKQLITMSITVEAPAVLSATSGATTTPMTAEWRLPATDLLDPKNNGGKFTVWFRH